MEITNIDVPAGIRYISEWENFKLPEYPNILDKQIPGCGFTEWCITNNMDVILVCPRRILLENKKDQHKEDVHLVKSYYQELSVDKSISSKKVSPEYPERMRAAKLLAEEKARINFEIIKGELLSYWYMRKSEGKPCKVLVTYDSYRKVKEIFSEIKVFEDFYTVVDEFQSIFVDSRFKSDTELEFVNDLVGIQKVCYVSATPMIKEYLEQLSEFKDLPYTKLHWETLDSSRVAKPGIKIRILKSINSVAEKIIDDYRSGKFEKSARVLEDGSTEIVESREAVFYVNSVNNIINIIKDTNMSPEEVNILCANNSDNQSRITKKLGRKFIIGRVPLKNEPRKMFTFCTRTIYLGADLYSDNARTFVISDANIDSMAVDITLDLPQILGRQRLEENPWKNKATVYVRSILPKNVLALKEFNDMIEEKVRKTESLLRSYGDIIDNSDKHSLAEEFERMALTFKYKYNYVAVNNHSGRDMQPVLNNLALIAERRAYDIQQVDYADRFSVFNRICSTFENADSSDLDLDKEILEFQEIYSNAKTNERKMEVLCTTELSPAGRNSVLDLVPEYFKRFYIILGPDRCKSLGYKYSKMEMECKIKTFDINKVRDGIYNEFKVGDKITLSEIKLRLRDLYESLDYKKVPKATDIVEWFDVKDIRILFQGKYSKGFELLKIRDV